MWWVKQTADVNMEKRFHRSSSKKEQNKIIDNSLFVKFIFFSLNQRVKRIGV